MFIFQIYVYTYIHIFALGFKTSKCDLFADIFQTLYGFKLLDTLDFLENLAFGSIFFSHISMRFNT